MAGGVVRKTSLFAVAALCACQESHAGCGGNCGTTNPTPQVHGISVSPTAAVLSVGATTTLVASVNGDSGVSTGAIWTSSNLSIASVTQGGVVTAASSGTAVVTATSAADGRYSASATITVNPCAAHGVSLSQASVALRIGGPTLTLTAIVQADACASQLVNWSTSNAAVFTVSQQGVVTAVGAGTATLTVTSQADGTRFATAIVTVTDPCAPIAYQLGSTVSGTITTANCLNTISTGAAWYGNVFTYSDVTPLLDPGILTDRGG